MKNSRSTRFIKSCLKNRNFMIGIIMVLIVVLVAVFADVIAPYNFDDAKISNKYIKPCSEYLFGTDDFGRDVFSRVIYGSRISLSVSMLCSFIQVVIGVCIGLLAGFYGGKIDRFLSFVADLTWSIPAIVTAMAVATVLGKSLQTTVIAIAIVSWAQYARVVRAKTQALKNMAFVETGIAFNENDFSIMFYYILPNIVPSIIVLVSMAIPTTIMYTTALSFLGLGAQAPSPDWGLALSTSMKNIGQAPWLAIFPGVALVFTVFAFNLLGEGLRDLLDPRLRTR